MLERLSAFVLEVLPYVLTTVIAAVLIPGFVYSQIHGTNAVLGCGMKTNHNTPAMPTT